MCFWMNHFLNQLTIQRSERSGVCEDKKELWANKQQIHQQSFAVYSIDNLLSTLSIGYLSCNNYYCMVIENIKLSNDSVVQ